MRDLKRAAREGPKALLHSLAGFPKRHPLLLAGFAAGLLGALTILGAWGFKEASSAKESVNVLRPQVTQIFKAAAACKPPVTPKRLPICVARIEAGLEACRLSPECRAAFAEVLAAPERGGAGLKGVVTSSGHSPSSQSGPHHGGGAKNGPQNPSSPGKAPSQPKEAPRTVGSAPASGGESSSGSPDQGSSKPPGLVEHAAGVAQEAAEEVTGSVGSAVEGIGGVAEGGVCGTVAAPGCSK